MASILPATLNWVQEYKAVDVQFTASLGPDETLTSIKIIEHNFPNTITVQGARFFGTFRDVFSLGPNAIKYRLGEEYKTTDAFNKLPKGSDVYSYTAPGSLQTDFNLKVELTYTKTATGESGSTSEVLSIVKPYIQTVKGDYGRFADQLITFVNGG